MNLPAGMLCTLTLAAILGCRRATDRWSAWRGTVDTLADTITVTTSSGYADPTAAVRRFDSLTVFWAGSDLSSPRALVVTDNGRLAVLDQDRVFVLSPEGSLERTVGRRGEGPGEFVDPAAIGAVGDTIFVYDDGNRRLSAFLLAGDFLRSWTVTPPPDRVNFERSPIAVQRDTLFGVWGSIAKVAHPAPTTVAAVAVALEGPHCRLEAVLDGPTYTMLPNGNIAPRELFGPRPIFAFSVKRDLAWADGREFCLWTHAAGATRVLKLCRTWTRVPMTRQSRHPDLDNIPGVGRMSDNQKQGLMLLFDGQQSGAFRNSIDHILWDSEGNIWVRTIDSAQINIHPWLLDRVPEARPSHFRWNVFHPDGRLAKELFIPSGLDLQAVHGGRGYGFAASGDGTPFVAVLPLGEQ